MIYVKKHLLFAIVVFSGLFMVGISQTKGNDIITGNLLQLSPAEGGFIGQSGNFGFFNILKPENGSLLFNYILVNDEPVSASNGSSTSTLETMRQRFTEATLKVKILVAVLIYLVLSILVLFVSILINRHIKTRKRRKTKELRNEYQEQLASFLFDDEVERIEVRGINKKDNRQLFIDELMELHNNLHGEVAGKLRDLYFNLELHKDSLQKVYKGKWYQKAKGFGELAQMDVKDANEEIEQYTNTDNPILRMGAQVAMVKLAEERPLSFLDNLKHELSYWEQINIYDTLIFHQISIDSFEEWLDNDNPSVVIFCLRMIELFKHVHSGAKVRELLFNENPEISLAAVKAMGALEITEYSDDLKMLYKSETLKLVNILETQRKDKDEKEIRSLDDLLPRKIRYEIVRAISPIASSEDVSFLEQVVLEPENSYKLRLLAISVLLSLKPEGENRIHAMLDGDDELVKKMINNVKQNQES